MSANENNGKSCKCPNCGANMIVHRQRLSKGLVNTLIKFKKSVTEHQRNKIHLRTEVSLTKNEYNNAQKLRYHGLIAKFKNPETKEHQAGYWLLTKRGNEFCKDAMSLPQCVYTFRNKIVDKDSVYLRLSDILADNDVPVWDERSDFPAHYPDIHDIDGDSDFDENGQGKLF